MSEENGLDRAEAIRKLWKLGILKYKLHDIQKSMYDVIQTTENEITTILCSRRIGKSFMLTLMATEMCQKIPNAVVKYVCPRKKMVKTIIAPIMRVITADCPPELKPEFKTQDSMFVFPNGSQIQLAGTDNGHVESIRGGFANLCIVDEAGFCSDLRYVVNTVLAPTLDTTDGKLILASTPSRESTHEFITQFVFPTEERGELLKYTIHDNPMMTEEKIKRIINRYPLKERDPEFRREYLCEIVQDYDTAVIPEFTEELKERIITEWDRPPLFDCYCSMDIGFKDFTILLFGYYDFKKAKLVVCDELVLNGPQLLTPHLAKAVKEKEAANFTDKVTLEVFVPKRVADNNNLILLQDLHNLHGTLFIPTAKDNKEAAINNVRMLLQQERIIIDPKCKVLISHLTHAAWNDKRTEFRRVAGYGHYDAVDSLVYMVRNVDFNKNPYPAGYGITSGDWFMGKNLAENNDMHTAIKKIFGINK